MKTKTGTIIQDQRLDDMIQRILAVGDPQKIVLFGSAPVARPEKIATTICC